MKKHGEYKGSEKCDEFIVAVNFKEQQGNNKFFPHEILAVRTYG